MPERLMGLETEYALTPISAAGELMDRRIVLGRMLLLSAAEFAAVRDGNTGFFLENGSRFYMDCGAHPEVSTPECTNPEDVVRYAKAGDRMMADLARKAEQEQGRGARVMVFRNNVDYSGSQTTWGSHESHQHSSDPGQMPEHLIGHLVSRIVFTGAGGFEPLQPGLEFVISPRSFYMERPVSADSTAVRPIYHQRDESLSTTGQHRLHVLCGESLGSETALWLRLGTTALVVALHDNGVTAGPGMQLRDPRSALRTFARDPQCRARVPLANGELASAITIQRRYLALVESCLGASWMPGWAPTLCQSWREMLDELDEDPQQLSAVLDWPLKKLLFERHAKSRGFRWEQIEIWSSVLRRVSAELVKQGVATKELTTEALLEQRLMRSTVEDLEPYLGQHGLRWDGFDAFLALRLQLQELDTRFGELGNGLFAALDRSGALEHRIVDVPSVEAALREPPQTSRARLRGAAIRAAAAERDPQIVADWQGVWDLRKRRFLDLGDPFETRERWRPISDADTMPPSMRPAQ